MLLTIWSKIFFPRVGFFTILCKSKRLRNGPSFILFKSSAIIIPAAGWKALDRIELPRRAESLLALRARALAKFGEVDTVPVSENSE